MFLICATDSERPSLSLSDPLFYPLLFQIENTLSQMTQLKGGGAVNMMIRDGGVESHMRGILRQAKALSFNNFLIDLPPKKLDHFLHIALQEGMMSSNYSFILTTIDLESLELKDYQWNKANVTAYRLIKSQTDLTKSKSKIFLNKFP